MNRSHPFRTLAAATGLVVLFAATVLIFEAYWGVGVFVSAVVALFALVEVIGQKINPHRRDDAEFVERSFEAWGKHTLRRPPSYTHVETVDEVARFDEDWDRACRMVDRWLAEDEEGEEVGGCPDNSCAYDAAATLAYVEHITDVAVCRHGAMWKLDQYAMPKVVYSGARFDPDRLVELP